ncbi:Stk1 family PASTA domain-containing Ser/Thr kinase [Merdimonas faecis]|uniref:non-specific serine/threonine protein kinase n=1 Tax=Merdimonas faecis TaxID=1653435 RepID=A0A9D2VZ18_9FIRM|nr:Stk1 family PASTA domain-containing Ser/Thr kinase [Merdimonas faecis]HJH50321.1 Stk1 family PASTA domain-containing Ser/Thr kinase [Merdimonas faecis]
MVKDGIVLGKRYEVLSKVGAGGMADVYKGRDQMLNRYVAIKVLKKEFREDENFVRKFRSEAQASAGLLHPNVVNVYDVGEDRGLYYMVMELVEGITLKEYIEKKGRLSHKEVISIAIQMCSGIGAAHAAGIIHRDIKPQNIIISKDGKVKVTDFGIAKAVTSNTISTNAMGSVHYTSPEQARGGFSDQKSDIYSIGITLYEMVTGQVPFDGDSTVSVAIKHLQEEITAPSELVSDIPYSLEQIILKCTQKNAERRYPNTDELIQDLKRSLVDPDGDFVVIPPLGNADTLIITDEELDEIQNSYDEDEYDEDEYDEDEYDEDEYDEGEYDEDEYDVDDGKRGKGSDEVNPKMKKLTRILTVVVAIIIAFIVIFAIGRAAGIFRIGPESPNETEDMVEVPNVVGMTEDDAKETLNDEGLGFKVVSREESKEYEKGRVSEQKTEAGEEVAKNTTIEVVVSSGLVGDSITVPDVSGMTEDEAQSALENAGFRNISSEFTYHDSVPSGQVIGTTPEANAEATEDTEIVMQVSKGAERKTVPNVVGQKDADAQNAIKSAGLSVGTVTYEYSDSVAQGIVISQSVDGGKKVSAGTTVDLVISNGPEPAAKVNVPPVTGTSESNARQLIQNAGLSVGTVTYQHSSSVAAGYVISCSPGVGSSVDEGTSVSLVVSTGPEQTSPDPGTGGDDGDGETD